jgi:hypothetical protein
MAELDTSGGGKKKGGKVRSKKMSTRIDFTPMVDLGFLLITFFMLTTTLNKPQIMSVILPDDKDKPPTDEAVKESKVLTLMPGKDNKVYYYHGVTDAKLDSTTFGAEGLRKVLLDKMEFVRKNVEPDKEITLESGKTKMSNRAIFLIKPLEDSNYKNLVDIVDEMAICNVGIYVLMGVSDVEKEFVKDPSKPLKFSAAEQAAAAARK